MVYTQLKIRQDRKLDYYYDQNFQVSSKTDHTKAVNATKSYTLVINPIHENMFSNLSHYPNTEYKINYAVQKVDKNFSLEQKQQLFEHGQPVTFNSNDVKGADRYRYFKRPLLPYTTSIGTTILYSKPLEQNVEVQVSSTHVAKTTEPAHKTISVQTIYRESDAQTDPYSPDYILNKSLPTPELLALGNLKWNQGLPCGREEIEMIERARAKRAWEASLPVVKDKASFELRLKMMEEMELKEWREREEEIKRIQNARLVILEQVLRKREAEIEENNVSKVEKIWKKKMQEREAFLDHIQKKRIKAMRKLTEKRQLVEGSKKKDIIGKYADFGSDIYAPRIRDGLRTEKCSKIIDVVTKRVQESGIEKIEKQIPEKVFVPDTSVNVDKTRTQIQREQQLKLLENMIMASIEKQAVATSHSKTGKEHGKHVNAMEGLKFAQKINNVSIKPKTPAVEPNNSEENRKFESAILLQRFIRGRINQMMMYEGKERRLQLIMELRSRQELKKIRRDLGIPVEEEDEEEEEAVEEEIMDEAGRIKGEISDSDESKPSTAKSDEDKFDNSFKENTSDILSNSTKSRSIIDMISKQHDTSSKNLQRRKSFIMRPAIGSKLDGGRRKSTFRSTQSLLEDLEICNIEEHLDSSVNKHAMYEFLEETDLTQDNVKRSLSDHFDANIKSEYIGKTFDFLTKELTRLRQEKKISAVVKLAERTRRMREAKENGSREQEAKLIKIEDEVFKQIMEVNQESVESYLIELINSSIETQSSNQAREKVSNFISKINNLVDELEGKTDFEKRIGYSQSNSHEIKDFKDDAQITESKPKQQEIVLKKENKLVQLDPLQREVEEKDMKNITVVEENVINECVSSFLIPLIDKQVRQANDERINQKYLLAAHQTIQNDLISNVEKNLLKLRSEGIISKNPILVCNSPPDTSTEKPKNIFNTFSRAASAQENKNTILPDLSKTSTRGEKMVPNKSVFKSKSLTTTNDFSKSKSFSYQDKVSLNVNSGADDNNKKNFNGNKITSTTSSRKSTPDDKKNSTAGKK